MFEENSEQPQVLLATSGPLRRDLLSIHLESVEPSMRRLSKLCTLSTATLNPPLVGST